MKLKEKIIYKIKEKVKNTESKIKYRNKTKDFTRERKMAFENVVYYGLNKKGLTSKMEIEEFKDLVDIQDISSPAVLKQREKLNGLIYKDMMNDNLNIFYNEYSEEVKLFNGYILYAIGGSDFEIPNTAITRRKFNSTRDNTSVARALLSNGFDVLNHYILSTIFGPETTSEKELASKNIDEIKQLKLPFPTIRVQDRGYVSTKDIYYSNLNNDKFVVRLKKSDFKKQVQNMQSKDEIINIPYQYDRVRKYKDTAPDFHRIMEETKADIEIRVVAIELSTGELEYLATNLTEEDMHYSKMRELYKLRWEIETNYHTLKESLKIETITSSKDELIKQDIYSQMLAFNTLQTFIWDAQQEIDQSKYKHQMQVNMNMAVGFFKKYFIRLTIEEDKMIRNKLLNELSSKIEKYIEPVRPGRNYPRKKDKKNKYSINKRKSF